MFQFEKNLVEDQKVSWEVIDEKVSRKIMVYDKDLMLTKVNYKQGGVGTAHRHPHLQMCYIASGVFKITIGDDSKILKTGDVFLVPSNELHGAICIEDGLLVDVFNPMREDLVK